MVMVMVMVIEVPAATDPIQTSDRCCLCQGRVDSPLLQEYSNEHVHDLSVDSRMLRSHVKLPSGKPT